MRCRTDGDIATHQTRVMRAISDLNLGQVTRFRVGRKVRAAGTVVVLIFIGACSTLTPSNSALEAARSDYGNAESNENVFLFAGPELEDAGDALNVARKAWLRRATKAEVDGLALIVTQRVAVARQVAAQRVTELRKLGDSLNVTKPLR